MREAALDRAGAASYAQHAKEPGRPAGVRT